ncbi:MAG: hypothetical protein NVS3B21_15710 [Acidimicrobiales bacterium]
MVEDGIALLLCSGALWFGRASSEDHTSQEVLLMPQKSGAAGEGMMEVDEIGVRYLTLNGHSLDAVQSRRQSVSKRMDLWCSSHGSASPGARRCARGVVRAVLWSVLSVDD